MFEDQFPCAVADVKVPMAGASPPLHRTKLLVYSFKFRGKAASGLG